MVSHHNNHNAPERSGEHVTGDRAGERARKRTHAPNHDDVGIDGPAQLSNDTHLSAQAAARVWQRTHMRTGPIHTRARAHIPPFVLGPGDILFIG